MIPVGELEIIGAVKCVAAPTYELAGKEYPVEGIIQSGDKLVPLIKLNMMSDLKWHKMCLESRIKARTDPEAWAAYERLDAEKGGVEAVIKEFEATVAAMEAGS